MQLTNSMCVTQLILTPQRVASPKQLGPGLEYFIRKVVLLKEKKGVQPLSSFLGVLGSAGYEECQSCSC